MGQPCCLPGCHIWLTWMMKNGEAHETPLQKNPLTLGCISHSWESYFSPDVEYPISDIWLYGNTLLRWNTKYVCIPKRLPVTSQGVLSQPFWKPSGGPERGSQCPSSDTMCPTTRNVGLSETKGVDSNKQWKFNYEFDSYCCILFNLSLVGVNSEYLVLLLHCKRVNSVLNMFLLICWELNWRCPCALNHILGYFHGVQPPCWGINPKSNHVIGFQGLQGARCKTSVQLDLCARSTMIKQRHSLKSIAWNCMPKSQLQS